MQPLERAAVHKRNKQVRYYGTRKTDKFVRCYWKEALGVYRVEPELHSRLLRQSSIKTLEDFEYIPEIIAKHLRFVSVDWPRLERYLSKKFGAKGGNLFSEARQQKSSLSKVRRYLQRNGVTNFHRFLVPLRINKQVRQAVETWINNFQKANKENNLSGGEYGARKKESA